MTGQREREREREQNEACSKTYFPHLQNELQVKKSRIMCHPHEAESEVQNKFSLAAPTKQSSLAQTKHTAREERFSNNTNNKSFINFLSQFQAPFLLFIDYEVCCVIVNDRNL